MGSTLNCFSQSSPAFPVRGHSKKCKRYSDWNSPWHEFPFRHSRNLARHGVTICGAITNGKRWDQWENCMKNLCYFNCWYFNSTILPHFAIPIALHKKTGDNTNQSGDIPNSLPGLAASPCSVIYFNYLLLIGNFIFYCFGLTVAIMNCKVKDRKRKIDFLV